jgi:hypothetical protein
VLAVGLLFLLFHSNPDLLTIAKSRQSTDIDFGLASYGGW